MANNDRNFAQASTQRRSNNPMECCPHFPWDPQNRWHKRILEGLGKRQSPTTPLRLICQKDLTKMDVGYCHNKGFIMGKKYVEGAIFPCLTADQRRGIRDKNVAVQVVGHDQKGRKWKMEFKQENDGSMTYVLDGQWADMVSKNGWKVDYQLSIWGFPYADNRDGWKFGPDNGYNDIHLVFTVQR